MFLLPTGNKTQAQEHLRGHQAARQLSAPPGGGPLASAHTRCPWAARSAGISRVGLEGGGEGGEGRLCWPAAGGRGHSEECRWHPVRPPSTSSRDDRTRWACDRAPLCPHLRQGPAGSPSASLGPRLAFPAPGASGPCWVNRPRAAWVPGGQEEAWKGWLPVGQQQGSWQGSRLPADSQDSHSDCCSSI